MPAAEVAITEELVRDLLRDQHPDLAELPMTQILGGWDNALFRLGDTLAVRLPRRAIAAPHVEHEHRWLPMLAERLPLPIPAPVRLGRPGRSYPWSWAITRWIDGEPAFTSTPLRDEGAARTLGAFLRALHRPAAGNAPISPVRGVPLTARSLRVEQHLRENGELVDAGRIWRCWTHIVAARPWPHAPVWVHGDLHPGNVIVAGGRVAGVIDFGDLTAGDPATDLAAAWMIFAPEVRDTFRQAAADEEQPIDDQTWIRARGWALTLNLAWLAMSVDDEETTRQSLATIGAVLAEC